MSAGAAAAQRRRPWPAGAARCRAAPSRRQCHRNPSRPAADPAPGRRVTEAARGHSESGWPQTRPSARTPRLGSAASEPH